MTTPNGYHPIPLLETLASDWSRGRGCSITQYSAENSVGKLSASGPGFLYRWDDSQDPVLITFLPDGDHQIGSGNYRYLLFIGTTEAGLIVQSPHQSPHTIRTSDQQLQQQLSEIIKEARTCSQPHRTRSCEKLTTIVSAQRLVALCHEAHAVGHKGKHDAGSSAKNRFVTSLHDWLAGELENSVKLGDAAKHFKKSPRQLIRVLKEATGLGFAEHLTMHRLLLARTLLMRTDTSIMEVAKRSGFNSREQFIRSFNKAFSWTPLQFRKAWSKASLSNSNLEELCQIADRETVQWLSEEQTISTPEVDRTAPCTLVVANALHEIIELFSIDSSGMRKRAGLLDRGSMAFINRDNGGSQWFVGTPESAFSRSFVTPARHAIAIVSPGLKNVKSAKKKRAAG